MQKNMQGSDEFKIVYISKLANDRVCPAKALQKMIRTLHLKNTDPLFMIMRQGQKTILTAFKVGSVLAQCVASMGFYPKEFGFQACRAQWHIFGV